ncbi:MAG: hypothetical protein K1X44_09070, partial [Alphaproteobacteria bacterium]|nr:hypothetical protein [Alphaproteobacteria bacterium]
MGIWDYDRDSWNNKATRDEGRWFGKSTTVSASRTIARDYLSIDVYERNDRLHAADYTVWERNSNPYRELYDRTANNDAFHNSPLNETAMSVLNANWAAKELGMLVNSTINDGNIALFQSISKSAPKAMAPLIGLHMGFGGVMSGIGLTINYNR